MAKDVAALKAISQNLMHQNLSVTDGVYGILSENDVRKQIVGLSSVSDAGTDLHELEQLVKQLLRRVGNAEMQ
jgi:hypothetical protein